MNCVAPGLIDTVRDPAAWDTRSSRRPRAAHRATRTAGGCRGNRAIPVRPGCPLHHRADHSRQRRHVHGVTTSAGGPRRDHLDRRADAVHGPGASSVDGVRAGPPESPPESRCRAADRNRSACSDFSFCVAAMCSARDSCADATGGAVMFSNTATVAHRRTRIGSGSAGMLMRWEII